MSCTSDMDVAPAERLSTGAPDVARPPRGACALRGFSQTTYKRRSRRNFVRCVVTVGKSEPSDYEISFDPSDSTSTCSYCHIPTSGCVVDDALERPPTSLR